MGNYDKAVEYCLKALEIDKILLGTEHRDIAISYNHLGYLYEHKGDYDNALLYYLKALEIRKKVLGVKHPNTAWSYYSIGNVYYYMGDSDKALDYFIKAAESGNTEAQFRLGWMYGVGRGTIQDYEKAAKWYQKSAENGCKKAYNGLAWTYHLMGKYEKALPWAERAFAAFPDNPGIIDTLATVYQGLCRYNEALEQFEFCLKLKKEQNASDNSINQTEEKIAALKELMKSNS